MIRTPARQFAPANVARPDPQAGIALAVLLVALAMYSGESRAWCLERAVELAYGKRSARSNRAREIIAFRGWLRLLQIADIYIEWVDDGKTRSWAGNIFADWDQHSRKSATFHLDESFRRELCKYTSKIPALALFDLHRPDGWTNRTSYGPSVAALARIRLAAFFKAKRHQLSGADTHHARAGRLRPLETMITLAHPWPEHASQYLAPGQRPPPRPRKRRRKRL